VRNFFYSLRDQSIYYRFFQPKRVFKREMLQKQWATVDYRKNMSIVGLAQKGKHKEIVAIGSYYGEGESVHAEVAFLVREDYQGMGIGSYLLDILESIAKDNQYQAFTATVMSENAAMIHVFRKKYPKAEFSTYGREIEVHMPF
jgi:ribosomal protein S18 acetylase RimI-like enzyme